MRYVIALVFLILQPQIANANMLRSCNQSKELQALQAFMRSRLTREKVKDMTQENKDLSVAQSEYLREYARLSGTTEIEGEDGEVREIIYVAKLVKKARRNT